jgi:hypothetical protein
MPGFHVIAKRHDDRPPVACLILDYTVLSTDRSHWRRIFFGSVGPMSAEEYRKLGGELTAFIL